MTTMAVTPASVSSQLTWRLRARSGGTCGVFALDLARCRVPRSPAGTVAVAGGRRGCMVHRRPGVPGGPLSVGVSEPIWRERGWFLI